MVNTSMYSFVDGVDSAKLMPRQAKTLETKSKESFADTLKDVGKSENENPSTSDRVKAKESGKTEELDKNSKEISDDASKIKESDVNETEVEDTDVKEEVIADEDIEHYVNELVELMQKVADIFGVTIEDLSDTLQQLNMQVSDVTSIEGMSKLVLQMNGSENNIELLINPEMSRQMKDLMNALDGFNNDVTQDIGMKEDIDDKFWSKVSDLTGKNDTNVVSQENVNNEEIESLDSEEMPETDSYGKTQTIEKNIEISQTNQENNGKETGSGSNESHGNMADENLNQTTISGGFVENITNSITEALGDNFSAGQTESIVRQVIEQIKVTAREDFSSIEINLNPENLGKVGISVASKNGVLTAQISVETEAARNAIESQMAVLKESFNEQGIKIEDVEITLASHQFERNNESESRRNDEQKARKTTRRIRLEDIDALGNDEQAQETREEQNRILMGNTINYSA